MKRGRKKGRARVCRGREGKKRRNKRRGKEMRKGGRLG